MFWLAEPTSQTGSELFPVQHRLQNSESPKALCVSTGVYTFRRLISTFKVHMEVMGAFTIIDTTAIVLRAILPLMALSQGTITEFIHFWDFTSIRNGFWGHLVRSMADNTLGRGFSGNAVNCSFPTLLFLWIDIILLLFLIDLLIFFDVHTINNLLL